MKTILTLIISVFAIASTQAQIRIASAQQSAVYQEHWQYFYSMYNSNFRGVTSLAFYSEKEIDKNLKSKEDIYYHFKKGVKQEQPYAKSSFKYVDGLLTNYKYLKKGKLKTHFSFEYNEDGYYTRYYVGPKNSPKYDEQLIFNDSNRVVQSSAFNKKHKRQRKTIIKYSDNQLIVRKDIYDGTHLEPKFTWLYKYNEEGRRVQTEYYKKDKLKSKWVYSCDEEGKKVEDQKVNTHISCSLVENNNDGSYVKIYRTTDSKGKVQKSRWLYNKDSVLISYERINHRGVITNKYTNGYDEKGNRNVYTYYKKGGTKIRFRNEYKYNDERKIIENIVYNGKGKMRSKKQYKYDANGNTIEFSSFNSKGIIEWKYESTYDDKGELIAEMTYKKGKPYSQHYIEFTY